MQTNHKLRGLIAAITGALLFGAAQVALADSTDDLLRKLHDKGVLTDEEYDQFNTNRDTEKVKKNSEIKASFKDGISWESGDKQNAIALTGRIHFDYRNVSGYNEMRDTDTVTAADQFELRRARIGVKGKFYNNYEYEVVTNLVGSNANLVDTAWLNVNWWDQAQIRFGKFKQPFGMEQNTSSNNIDFAERSVVDSLSPGKQLGVMLHGEIVKGLNYGVSTYQSGFSETDSDTADTEIGGRVVANIAQLAGWSDAVLHVGLAASDGSYGVVPAQTNNFNKAVDGKTRATLYSFRSEARGLNNIYRAQIGGETLPATQRIFGASTGVAAEVDKQLYGLELAAAYGPIKLQSEYVKAEFDANYASSSTAATVATTSRVNADVRAWYAEALWMITGEKYADFYKGGVFGSIKPKNDFIHPSIASSSGGWGAWELGLRYSQFDPKFAATGTGAANSRQQGSTDGAKSYTAGIKWILNPNTRVLLNYVHTKFDTAFAPIDVERYVGTEKSENSIVLRGQLSF